MYCSVKTIRTCYPQNPNGNPNGTTAAANRSSKLEMLFYNKVHHLFVKCDFFAYNNHLVL